MYGGWLLKWELARVVVVVVVVVAMVVVVVMVVPEREEHRTNVLQQLVQSSKCTERSLQCLHRIYSVNR
jgi:nitrate/nitrite transporter NarK